MGKIYECSKCDNCSHWACPTKVTEKNYEYAVGALEVLKRSFVCGETGKVKPIGHKQQCKHFSDSTYHGKLEELYQRDIVELEKKILEYENSKENEHDRE